MAPPELLPEAELLLDPLPEEDALVPELELELEHAATTDAVARAARASAAGLRSAVIPNLLKRFISVTFYFPVGLTRGLGLVLLVFWWGPIVSGARAVKAWGLGSVDCRD